MTTASSLDFSTLAMTGFSTIVCIAGAAALIIMMIAANNDAAEGRRRDRRASIYRRTFTPRHVPIGSLARRRSD